MNRFKGLLIFFVMVSLMLGTLLNTQPAYADLNSNRLGGTDRFATAIQVSQEGWETSDYVVLANAYGFADALTGVPFAYKKDAPILLTQAKALPQQTLDEILRLKAKHVYILGGTGVISEDIEALLQAREITTERIAGNSRFGTAVAISDQVLRDSDVKTAVVTTAFNYPDALAIGPYSAIQGYPILYTEVSRLNANAKTQLQNKQITKVIIPGGTGAVSTDVEAEIQAMGITVERIAGNNRYDTAVNIVNKYSESFSDGVITATGKNFPDALAGGVLAAKKRLPILLVDNSGVTDGVRGYVINGVQSDIYVLGGTGVIADSIVNKLLYPVQGLTLDHSTVSMSRGEIKQLIATVTPANAADKTIIWTSSNTRVVSVNGQGRITGIGTGTAVVTATTKDGNIKATCAVNVDGNRSYFNLEKQDVHINSGQTAVVKVTLTQPYDFDGRLTYLIENTSVVSAKWSDWNGYSINLILTGAEVGTSKVSISLNNGFKKEICVSVQGENVPIPSMPYEQKGIHIDTLKIEGIKTSTGYKYYYTGSYTNNTALLLSSVYVKMDFYDSNNLVVKSNYSIISNNNVAIDGKYMINGYFYSDYKIESAKFVDFVVRPDTDQQLSTDHIQKPQVGGLFFGTTLDSLEIIKTPASDFGSYKYDITGTLTNTYGFTTSFKIWFNFYDANGVLLDSSSSIYLTLGQNKSANISSPYNTIDGDVARIHLWVESR